MSNKWILSATEIDTFSTCERKWAYQYLEGIKPPPTRAASLGLLVHEFLQKHLIGHSVDHNSPEGLIASAGFHYLPKRLPVTNVERPILFLNNGHIFHGYIDFYQEIGSQTWLIGDHKTCSNLSNALNPDQLKANIQANIYAQWAFQELGAQTVKLKWIYYLTKGKPRATSIETEIKKDDQKSLFEPLIQIASDIKTIVERKTKTEELPKNLNACFKYGRCAFYNQCKGTAVENRSSVYTVPREAKEYKVSSLCDAKSSSFHLYVDCLPTKASRPYKRTIDLSELLKPVLEKIQTEKDLKHYRLAGYGQHVGLIAHYLSDYLENNIFDNETAIISSLKTPEGCDTLQTLMAASSKVVRGF